MPGVCTSTATTPDSRVGLGHRQGRLPHARADLEHHRTGRVEGIAEVRRCGLHVDPPPGEQADQRRCCRRRGPAAPRVEGPYPVRRTSLRHQDQWAVCPGSRSGRVARGCPRSTGSSMSSTIIDSPDAESIASAAPDAEAHRHLPIHRAWLIAVALVAVATLGLTFAWQIRRGRCGDRHTCRVLAGNIGGPGCPGRVSRSRAAGHGVGPDSPVAARRRLRAVHVEPSRGVDGLQQCGPDRCHARGVLCVLQRALLIRPAGPSPPTSSPDARSSGG